MQENINTNNLELASMRSRAFAFVIDDLIVSIIVIAAYWNLISAASDDTEMLVNLMQTTLVAPLMGLKIVYQTFFVWYYGATVGKILAKVRVIDGNHWGRITLFQSFLRSFGRIFSEMFFYIGFLIAFFNDGRKTFHDFSGKTLVVNA